MLSLSNHCVKAWARVSGDQRSKESSRIQGTGAGHARLIQISPSLRIHLRKASGEACAWIPRWHRWPKVSTGASRITMWTSQVPAMEMHYHGCSDELI